MRYADQLTVENLKAHIIHWVDPTKRFEAAHTAFLEAAKVNPRYALENDGYMIAVLQYELDYFNRYAFNAAPNTDRDLTSHEAIEAELTALTECLADDIVKYPVWRHNSTNYLSNVLNQAKGEAAVSLLRKVKDALGWFKELPAEAKEG